jgi:hypothetical protein
MIANQSVKANMPAAAVNKKLFDPRVMLKSPARRTPKRAAMNAIASQVGCTAEALRKWARQTKIDQGKRYGLSSARLNFFL